MRLLFLQHGDYPEAWARLRAGGEESYREQRASVEFVEGLAGGFDVTVASICDAPHDERLAPKLRARGLTRTTALDPAALAGFLDDCAPQLMVLRTPNRGALAWARRTRTPALPAFADYFRNDGLREVWRNVRLRALLTAPVFPCVGNHSLNASRSVVRALRYPAGRVVPWERAPLAIEPEPKRREPGAPLSLFFAGALVEAKGVGDCLDALAALRRRGRAATLAVAGSGPLLDRWRGRAADLDVAGHTAFLGQIPNAEVRARMRASDAVIVASRHDYPEGMPNTLAEALAVRAPLVVSDHPVFRGRLRPDENCLEFRAGDPEHLADRLATLADDPALYARLSEAGAAAHLGLHVGVSRETFVLKFLEDPLDRTGWVEPLSLAALEADPERLRA
jgi:glycosyltransferase involved in cell wall biosynthesis